MNKLLSAIFLVYLALLSCSQPEKIDKDKEHLAAVCNKFMENFRDGKISAAMQLLKQNSVLDNSTIDTLLATTNRQLDDMLPSYGKMLSYEFIKESRINNIISKRFYILRFEKYYLKFSFTLYNSAIGWTITNYKYNEDLIELVP